jgi:hypothetical protein
MAERSQTIVGTTRGIEALEGRNCQAVLAAQPPQFLRFRRIWSDIRLTVKAWRPEKGEPFTGTVPLGRGG